MNFQLISTLRPCKFSSIIAAITSAIPRTPKKLIFSRNTATLTTQAITGSTDAIIDAFEELTVAKPAVYRRYGITVTNMASPSAAGTDVRGSAVIAAAIAL